MARAAARVAIAAASGVAAAAKATRLGRLDRLGESVGDVRSDKLDAVPAHRRRGTRKGRQMNRYMARIAVVAVAAGIALLGGVRAASAEPIVSAPPTGYGTLSAADHKRLGIRTVNPLDPCSWVYLAFRTPAGETKYVSVEWKHTGNQQAMLRARADTVGSWEWLYRCRNLDTGAYYFQAPVEGNPSLGWRYVTADFTLAGNDNGLLRARGEKVDYYELFFLTQLPDRWFNLQGWHENGSRPYVAAEYGDTGENHNRLRARSSAAGVWERFAIYS
jgi:hypothetical protein